MRKSWMFLTVLGALLIGALTPAVLADSHVDAVFCGELSEADCELLQNATDAANAQPYGAADFELDLLLSEFDGDEESEFWNLTISGSGAYAFAPALMEQMLAIEADPTMLTGEGLVSLLDNLVTGFSGDLELSIFLPLDMMAEITEPDENGDFSDIPLNLRVVDGIAYLDTSVLAMLMSDGSGAGAMPMMGPGDMDSQPGWIGIDLGDLLEMSAADLTDMEMMPESDELDMLSERELLEQYATIERVGDSESSDGQTLAVFETVVDLNALLQDPAMLELMEGQMNSARASAMANIRREASVMSADEANEAGPMMQDMMDDFSIELPTSIELSTYESVGLEDGLLHGMEALLLVEMPSPPVMGENDEPGSFEMRLYFGAGFRDHDVVPEIAAPEDAFIIPLQDLAMAEAMSAGIETSAAGDGIWTSSRMADGKADGWVHGPRGAGRGSDAQDRQIAALIARAAALEARAAALEARVAALEARSVGG